MRLSAAVELPYTHGSLNALVAALALSAEPTLRAPRVDKGPVLDGKVDEAVWESAATASAFTQKFPREGAPPTEATRLRVLRDGEAIYFAFECRQRTVPVLARMTRRDRLVESDRVTIAIDSRHDRRTAFEFTVNAAGVLSDAYLFNDVEVSRDWTENWDARVSRSTDGWSAEIKIPFRVLRFGAEAVQTWGLQARRYVAMRQEIDEWAFIPRGRAAEVSAYGTLVGIDGVPTLGRVEVRPYVVAGAQRRDPSAEVVASGLTGKISAGLDLKWQPLQSFTLDTTFNPDFAQVEADQVVFNLTPNYEVYLPERRPFFLEGLDLFWTPLTLLYTRRLGRVSPSPVLAPGERLVDRPSPASLYFASKAIGRFANQWSVGALNAVSAPNEVLVETPTGERAVRVAEPLTSFNVLRVRRELSPRSYVGVMLTSTNRAEATRARAQVLAPGGGLRALCPTGLEVPLGARCFGGAHVASVDARWRSAAGDYVAAGQLVTSVVDRVPDRTLPDGTVVRSGDAGAGALFSAAKEGGAPWIGRVAYQGATPRLELNDLGYLRRQNEHVVSGSAGYRTLEPWFATVETRTQLEAYAGWNAHGLFLGGEVAANTWWRLDGFWELWAEVHARPSRFDDREMGTGAALERAGLVGVELAVSSDRRRDAHVSLSLAAQRMTNATAAFLDGTVAWNVLPQLEVQVSPQLYYNSGEPRYVGDAPGRFLFGDLRVANVGSVVRATYAFTPRLSLQAYAQVFLAAGHYEGFRSYSFASARDVVRLSELVPDAGPTTNPDFVDATLNVNAVLRWEYMLGSTIFLVYARAHAPRVGLAPGETASLDLGALGRATSTDSVFLKVTYWWGG